ncbi:ExbD/TolR family protein [Curvivirga aplysinae]|uniref:ExbD/TolR family protein n=1 Tax=Curvivirga aplysinae TaxID=2529852 RepID=UPI0012BC7543|nr:biopolymer transporter ExbD [Curvivirga aplysinae]MTI08718.1 biopolymer transporter ExbD [Curvivirga aplysinae]
MSSIAQQYKRRKLMISLTPLIDVVFILLIFFMLASSFAKNHSLELNIPANGTANAKSDIIQDDKTRLKILGEGKIEINQTTYVFSEISSILLKQKNNRLLIEVGDQAIAQDMVQVMDLVSKLALEKVSLLPYKKKENME